MAIRYSLIENKLTPDPNDYRAQVEHNTSVGIEEVAGAIARPGSTVTKAEILAFWEEFSTEVTKQLLLGNRVVLDLFVISASIEGVFNGDSDPFDPTRHTLNIRLTPNTRLRKALLEMEVEQVNTAVAQPTLKRVEDFTTDAVNSTLTPGGTARLTGELLKFDPTDTQQGLYLVAANGTETKVEKVKTNLPSEQLFIVPAGLSPGDYKLVLRSKPRGNARVREVALATLLTVT